ncbi:MAG: ABC transporter permease, partial [Chloroflexota bacterium]|nr:ABC transporter permease [Chloroflexota bacterium]
LAGCLFLGFLGPVLHLSDWVMDLSPFSHIPQVPATSLTMAPLAVLTGIAAVLAAVGLFGFQRRDIG